MVEGALLPKPDSVDFRETSFFQNAAGRSPAPELPNPAQVRAQPIANTLRVVSYENVDLVVKFGDPDRVNLAEGQALEAVGRDFPNREEPVPELVAWRRSECLDLIYMSYILGSTLKDS